MNFCWYTNQCASGLRGIMTDTEGVEYHTSVAPGKVRPDLWAKQCALARSIFIPQYLEIINNIKSPFIHLFTDYWSPQACFADGKVLLVGDSSCLVRPHIAFSTNQAAFQCMMVEKLVKGELSPKMWDWQVTNFTYMHWTRSVWFGEYFQSPLSTSLWTALRYWSIALVHRIRYVLGKMPHPRS